MFHEDFKEHAQELRSVLGTWNAIMLLQHELEEFLLKYLPLNEVYEVKIRAGASGLNEIEWDSILKADMIMSISHALKGCEDNFNGCMMKFLFSYMGYVYRFGIPDDTINAIESGLSLERLREEYLSDDDIGWSFEDFDKIGSDSEFIKKSLDLISNVLMLPDPDAYARVEELFATIYSYHYNLAPEEFEEALWNAFTLWAYGVYVGVMMREKE